MASTCAGKGGSRHERIPQRPHIRPEPEREPSYSRGSSIRIDRGTGQCYTRRAARSVYGSLLFWQNRAMPLLIVRLGAALSKRAGDPLPFKGDDFAKTDLQGASTK